MTLTFEAQTHTYRYGEETIPSVTQILSELKLTKDYTGVDPFYRDRGTAVHKCIELHLKGTLDENSIDPVCLPYFNAFREFLRDCRDRRFDSEVPLFSKSSGFAGTVDLIAYDDDASITLYDVKCTESVDRSAELQLCAYQLLVEQNYKKKIRAKFPLQLRGDGSFEIIDKYTNTNPAIWDSVMTIWRWKKNKK